VIVRELSEVALVAAIIAVRATLTFLIHREIKQKNKCIQIPDKRGMMILETDRA